MEMSNYENGKDTLESPLRRNTVTKSGLENKKYIFLGVSVALCVIVGCGIGFGLDHDTIGMSLLC